jgi:hypothetical protein
VMEVASCRGEDTRGEGQVKTDGNFRHALIVD